MFKLRAFSYRKIRKHAKKPKGKSKGKSQARRKSAPYTLVADELLWADETQIDAATGEPIVNPLVAGQEFPTTDGINILATYSDDTYSYELNSLCVDYYEPGAMDPTISGVITYNCDSNGTVDNSDSLNVDTTSPESPFEDFEQYYDENSAPQYDASGCESSIGIRG